MKLKNSTSTSKNTFDKIQKILSSHGAQRIIFDYNQKGQIAGLQFAIQIENNVLCFKLPARVESTSKLMYGCLLSELGESGYADKRRDQAYKTTWANIRDWIDAQMAMIDTNQVKFEEVFFPYIIDRDGVTIFEKIKKNNFLLTSGK